MLEFLKDARGHQFEILVQTVSLGAGALVGDRCPDSSSPGVPAPGSWFPLRAARDEQEVPAAPTGAPGCWAGRPAAQITEPRRGAKPSECRVERLHPPGEKPFPRGPPGCVGGPPKGDVTSGAR